MPKLIVVANRLPVTVEGDTVRKSSGGLVAGLDGVRSQLGDIDGFEWIGWPGAAVEGDDARVALSRRLRDEAGATPVFLSAEQVAGHYEGFSNSTVWPTLHYLPSYVAYQPGWWETYEQVNRAFADVVLDACADGDLIWVHDYQLMLLPEMLRRARPALRIGFFLHVPFPAYEVFRILPRRAELMAGMLGADLLGFHTVGYLRHFRDVAQRLLGAEADVTRVTHDGRAASLGVYPIGINAQRFADALAGDEHRGQLAALRENHPGRRLVVSVERLDYTKGILRRLDAIELFLSRADAGAIETLKFLFVSVPSRENVDEYRSLREEIESRVGRINGTYATLRNSPLHFLHQSVSFAELTALYAAAEVALVTPLIDGMNLVAKEFVAAQPDGAISGAGGAPGVLVLSEFAGAAEELLGALRVNPYDPENLASALAHALAMPADERRGRMAAMKDRVTRFDARWWSKTFVDDLKAVQPAAAAAPADDLRRRLVEALGGPRRVAAFIDYDGTLRALVGDPAAAAPDDDARASLSALAELARADVTIISGRTADDLERFVGDRAFGLVAEHGAALRRPGSREWEHLPQNRDVAWRTAVRAVLRHYTETTPGSFVEEKRAGLVWHYRGTDEAFGRWRAQLLVSELTALTAGQSVHVRHGKRIVEVNAADVSKGAVVRRLVEGRDYGLILVVGDDATDETMFRLDLEQLLSVKIGDGPTAARHRLPDPAALRALLQDVASAARRTNQT